MVKGLRKLKRKMRRTIPRAVRAATRDAMRKGAEEVVSSARQFVPRGETGELHDSIGWTFGDPPGGSLVLGERKAANDSLVLTVFAGNKKAFYVRFVEFGTQGMSAQPFFFPAYRLNQKRIKSRVTRSMKKAIREGAR